MNTQLGIGKILLSIHELSICALQNSRYCQAHKEIERTLIAFYIQLYISIPLVCSVLFRYSKRNHDRTTSIFRNKRTILIKSLACPLESICDFRRMRDQIYNRNLFARLY